MGGSASGGSKLGEPLYKSGVFRVCGEVVEFVAVRLAIIKLFASIGVNDVAPLLADDAMGAREVSGDDGVGLGLGVFE